MDQPAAIATAGVVLIDTGKVLLVRHGQKAEHLTRVYGLPAGRLEKNETAMDAAIRELAEETGLRVSPKQLIKLPKTYQASIKRKDGTKLFSYTVFAATVYEGALLANAENQPVWVSVDRLADYPLLPNVYAAIHNALSVL